MAIEYDKDRGTRSTLVTRWRAMKHITATHPDTGLEVTFVPGDSVPDWAVENYQRSTPGESTSPAQGSSPP